MGMAEEYQEFLDERCARIAADKSLEETAQALIDEATSSPRGSETRRLLVEMPEAIVHAKRAIEMLMESHGTSQIFLSESRIPTMKTFLNCTCSCCKTAREALEKIKAVMG